MPCLYGIQWRPDSSELHHPPPSPANCALQRRMRFSARLAEFCRDRCHQRRARRAELASFSVFVSNLDFRVPRLRQIGERALTGGPCGQRKRGRPKGSDSRLRLPWRSWPSTFWSRCGPGLLYVHLCPGPGSRSPPGSVASRFWTVFPCAYGEPESPAATSPSQGCDLKKEDRPEAADYGTSKTRNQRRSNFLQSTGRSSPGCWHLSKGWPVRTCRTVLPAC